VRSELRIAVVVNARSSSSERLRRQALARLRESACMVAELATGGDPGDGERIARLVRSHQPDVLVAAGGDGTASLALRALLEARCASPPTLGLLPLGTGNNAARSFGLRALRDGADAVALAVAAIVAGPRRAIDVGLLDGRPFLGSVAIGMDADVLALRNRLHQRLAGMGLDAGYALYLGASLGSLLSRHGAPARLTLDGKTERLDLFGLCVVNAPVYAGPIRFDAANDCTDGRLDVLALRSGREYAEEYVGGWLRYLRTRSRAAVRPSARLRRAQDIRVDFERPVAAQADGEWLAAAASYRISVLPGALRLCLPDPQQ
jgi:diacylglycerol kinase family enzyme